jgi:methionyl-tRNA formyltransferase
VEKKIEGGKGIAAPLPGLIFLGTPCFAVPSLRKLLESGVEVRLVITQPDRPSGRGRKICYSPVKTLAMKAGIPVYQPKSIRGGGEVIEKVRSYGAQCAVVVAFGQILPQSFLDVFALGTLNVHGSLLPKYRGAAPIQRAILAGESETGLSIMLLDAGMDTGPVLSQKKVAVGPEDTFGHLFQSLADEGAGLLLDTLADWTAGRLKPEIQEESLATYAPPIKKEELRIDWNSPAKDIINKVRAFDPAPGAWFFLGGKRVKCFSAVSFPWDVAGARGEIIGMAESGLVVSGGCGQSLSIGELQTEGQRRMRACEFVRGRPIPVGSFLE